MFVAVGLTVELFSVRELNSVMSLRLCLLTTPRVASLVEHYMWSVQ